MTDSLEVKRFSKNDDGFICVHCGAEVHPLKYTSRNHCPFCLWSRHLDINPGDRANECGGLMRPIRSEPDAKRGFVIIHKCEKCGEIRRNRAALNAKEQPDNRSLLVRLTAGIS
jgi:predicted RNA-binding Zn-ribbon protein involved in translation (DUF1610 family)